jgi:hypothetical protein
MRARRYLRLAWLLLGLALAACAGGSGSSGFDAFPTENAAIQQALDQQRCVERQGLTICPADQMQTTPAQPRVDTGGIDQNGFVGCVQSPSDGTCSFTLPFAPQGFQPNTAFRVAVRLDTTSPWTIGGDLPPKGTPTAPNFDAPVSIVAQPEAPGNDSVVQLAILAFLNPTSAVSGEFAELAASHADFAFVTPEVTLRPASP